MDSSTKACMVLATALWATILVAGFTAAPENAGSHAWQPAAASKLLNRAARPDLPRPAVAHAEH
ncbi:MAG TPA: hypothetical protein VF601_04205 [Beijerinckiaceae bacterium]|jgi:hypothetical protein